MIKLSKEEVIEYIHKYNLWTYKKLADFFEVNKASVSYYFKKHKMHILPMKREAIKTDLEKGISNKIIHEKYGICQKRIYYHRVDNNLPLLRRRYYSYTEEDVKRICVDGKFSLNLLKKQRMDARTLKKILEMHDLCAWFNRNRLDMYGYNKKNVFTCKEKR